MSSGWSWPMPTSSNLCDPTYGFSPRWSQCPANRTVSAAGFLQVKDAGLHCFKVKGTEPSTCASLFVNANADAAVSGESTTCYTLPTGRVAVQWTRVAAPGVLGSQSIDYCYGGDAPCEPTSPIPTDLLRPDDCTSQDSCSPECPCEAGEGPCTTDAGCSSPLLCAGDGPLFHLAEGTLACITEEAANNPGAPGSYAEPEFCDPDVPNTCPASEQCLPVGPQHGYPSSTAVCVNTQLCSGPLKEVYCGHLDSPCGFCECTPDCSDKECSDHSDDGCGGQCFGYCAPGELGCTSTAACALGQLCLSGQCVDPICGTVDCTPEVCGDLCPACQPECGGRQCGAEPRCGSSCGECGGGVECLNGFCPPT